MSTPIADALRANDLLDKKIEASETVLRKIQDETRNMREAAADLKAAYKAAEALRSELMAIARRECSAMLQEAATAGIDAMGKETQAFIASAQEAVNRRFDHLTGILLGEGHDGKKSIVELADDIDQLFHFKWEVFVHLVKEAQLQEDPTGTCSARECGEQPVYAARFVGMDGKGHAHLCPDHKKKMHEKGYLTTIKKIPCEEGKHVCPWPDDHGEIRPFSSSRGLLGMPEIVRYSIKVQEEMKARETTESPKEMKSRDGQDQG